MKSGEVSDRDRMVIAHIARFRVTFAEIVSQLYCAGVDARPTLKRLEKLGLVESRKGLGNNRNLYQIRAAGAKVVGASRSRAEALGSAALPTWLAVLAYCFLNDHSRIRLEPKEMLQLMGCEPPGTHHCLERSFSKVWITRLYVPDQNTSTTDILATLRDNVERALAEPHMRPWLAGQLYRFAILVEQPRRVAEFRAALDEAALDNSRRLMDVAHFRVERIPALNQLEEALDALAKRVA